MLVAVSAMLVTGCDVPDKRASTPVQATTEQDAAFERSVTAGKMLSELHTYLGSRYSAPQTFTFDRLSFDRGSSQIRSLDQPTIHTLAVTLENYPTVRAQVVGFGDGDSSGLNNGSLGLQRARAIMQALTKLGVDRSRLGAAAGREANGQRAAQLIILRK